MAGTCIVVGNCLEEKGVAGSKQRLRSKVYRSRDGGSEACYVTCGRAMLLGAGLVHEEQTWL